MGLSHEEALEYKRKHCQKIGRHRTFFQGNEQQSPPRYWSVRLSQDCSDVRRDIDLPDTQDREEIRIEARRREREKFERIEAEALAGDGRYVFRTDKPLPPEVVRKRKEAERESRRRS